MFAGQQEGDQSNNGESKGTYSAHILISPLIILHHSTIPLIFSLICLNLQGFCVFYRIPCKPTVSPKILHDHPIGIIVAWESKRN